jgi:hypothetical protein
MTSPTLHGKTYLALEMIREMQVRNVPVIVLDSKPRDIPGDPYSPFTAELVRKIPRAFWSQDNFLFIWRKR